jgi:SAM-dependent methyltransferase
MRRIMSEYAKHREYVGPPERYDLASANPFNLLTAIGMREDQTLLDIGCGSLRAGRLFLMYLKPGMYYGIEPNQWLIDDGIKNEIGQDLVNIKRPTFSNDDNFTLTTFGRTFDFMLAQSIFSHATQSQIRRCFSEVKKALAPTGIFAATYFIGDTNYEGTEWVYPGRVHYTEAYFAQMAADNGLAVKKLNWSHSNEQTWVAITHPEYQSQVPDIADASRIAVLEQLLKMTREKLEDLQSLSGLKLVKKLNRAIKGKRKK